jgi:glycerol transport system ATP-binding protein
MDSTNIKIGIRPEFIHVWDKPSEGAFSCELVHVEDLGTYKILTLTLDGQQIKVRLDEDRLVPKGNVFVSFPEQWLKVYVDEFLIEAQEYEGENTPEKPVNKEQKL